MGCASVFTRLCLTSASLVQRKRHYSLLNKLKICHFMQPHLRMHTSTFPFYSTLTMVSIDNSSRITNQYQASEATFPFGTPSFVLLNTKEKERLESSPPFMLLYYQVTVTMANLASIDYRRSTLS